MSTTMRNRILILLIWWLSSSVKALKSFLGENTLLGHKLENKELQWVPIDEDTQFLQADEHIARRLEQGNSANPYATQAFVDGDVEYDEYQQAWRYLGFMIDCDSSNDDDEEGGGSGSNDGTGEGCARYIVWAAYVDLNYEGGGIAEYQYWDPTQGQWNSNACNYNQNGDSSRCVQMDCHKSNTHFSLLGIFKHQSYDDWMEQLFKHEGYCVWTSKEYRFMNANRDVWPEGCRQTDTYTNDGDPIYYDLKPTSDGGMTMGLYTDTRCVDEYTSRKRNDPINVENVLGNIFGGNGGGSGDWYYDDDVGQYNSFSEGLAAWESGFDRWRVCQPCVAYDINNVGYFTDDDASKGSSYFNYNPVYDDYYNDGNYGWDDQSGDVDGDWTDFDCYDKAGYTNVNQCMKFMAKTVMKTATYRDLALVMQQGTTADVQINTFSTQYLGAITENNELKSFFAVVLFICSCGMMLLGINCCRRARRKSSLKAPFNIKEPLVLT